MYPVLLTQFLSLFLFFSFGGLLNMKRKSRSGDLFGGATAFSGAKLPTHEDCGKQWRQCRLEMEAAQPGSKIQNRDIAREVNNLQT